MKRAERRYHALGEARALKIHISQHWPQFRLPGSLKPFSRINALVEAVVKAQNAIQNLIELQQPKLLAKLVGRVELTPEQVKVMGDAQVAVVRARDALAAYESRGHGRTLSYGRIV